MTSFVGWQVRLWMAFAVAGCMGISHALEWTGGDGDWSNAQGWELGAVPLPGDTVLIARPVTVTLVQDASIQILNLNGGSTLRQTGGLLEVTAAVDGSIGLGERVGESATYLLEGGSVAAAGNQHIGRYGTGTLDISGGLLASWLYFSIGRYSTGVGTVRIHGTGRIDKTGTSMLVGEDGAGTCIVEDGGLLTVNPDVEGLNGVPGGILIAWTPTATGTLRINRGGVVATPHVSLVNANAKLVLDGGVLGPRSDMGSVNDFIFQRAGHVCVGSGGALIDSKNSSCSIAASFEPLDAASTGGFVKLGEGTVVLSGNNSWNGTTIISNGMLVVEGPNSLPGYDQAGRVVVEPNALLFVGDGWTEAQISTLKANMAGDATLVGVAYDTLGGDRTISENLDLTAGLIKTGANTLTLLGHNSYAADAQVLAGLLQGDFGVGLDVNHGVVLNGGALSSPSGRITAPLGTGAGSISFARERIGGFSAKGVPLTVNLGGESAPLELGTGAPSVLVLNGAEADQPLTFENPLALTGSSATIFTDRNEATLAGGVQGASETPLYVCGAGRLVIGGESSFHNLQVDYPATVCITNSVTLSFKYWGNGGTTIVDKGGSLILSNLDFWIGNNSLFELRDGLVDVAFNTAFDHGTFRMTGGTLRARRVGDVFGIGGWWDANMLSARLEVSGGSVEAFGNLHIGRTGDGTLLQTGGDIRVDGWPSVARYVNSRGLSDHRGGTFRQTHPECGYVVGEEGSGVVKVSGTADVDVNGSHGLYYLPNPAGQSGEFMLNGGTVSVQRITCTLNGTNRLFRFDGGTLRTRIATDRFIDGDGALTAFEIGPGGGAVDTLGNSVTFNQPLTPSVVDGGPVHRWSFNGDWRDSVGGGEATGDGGAVLNLSENACQLPGGGHGAGAVNLGSDLLPKGPRGFTIEIWARHDQVNNWARLFDIGDVSDNYFLLAWSMSTSLEFAALGVNGARFGVGEFLNAAALGGFALGREFHIAVVVAPQASGRYQLTAYKQDAVTGETLAVGTQETPEGWAPANQPCDNFWLGRSLFAVDADAAATYNEVRIWDRPLAENELTASVQRGPDAVFGLPFRKTGDGTLLLTGANTYTAPTIVEKGVLALAPEASLPATESVTIKSGATFLLTPSSVCPRRLRVEIGPAGGRVLKPSGVLDVEGVSFLPANPEGLARGRSYVVAEAPDGIAGVPSREGLPSGWILVKGEGCLRLSNGGSCLILR